MNFSESPFDTKCGSDIWSAELIVNSRLSDFLDFPPKEWKFSSSFLGCNQKVIITLCPRACLRAGVGCTQCRCSFWKTGHSKVTFNTPRDRYRAKDKSFPLVPFSTVDLNVEGEESRRRRGGLNRKILSPAKKSISLNVWLEGAEVPRFLLR